MFEVDVTEGMSINGGSATTDGRNLCLAEVRLCTYEPKLHAMKDVLAGVEIDSTLLF